MATVYPAIFFFLVKFVRQAKTVTRAELGSKSRHSPTSTRRCFRSSARPGHTLLAPAPLALEHHDALSWIGCLLHSMTMARCSPVIRCHRLAPDRPSGNACGVHRIGHTNLHRERCMFQPLIRACSGKMSWQAMWNTKSREETDGFEGNDGNDGKHERMWCLRGPRFVWLI